MPSYRFPADSRNTFRLRGGLAELPRLVKRQRRLERKAAAAQRVLDQEKACRDAIDALLLKAGYEKGTGPTCLGYDVVHHERAGRSSVNPDKLRGAGVAEVDIQFATERGKPSSYATVRPMKGAEVQAA
jgi:hypothetical protein